MNSKEMKEQISALVDSELPESALGAVLVGLRNGDEHAAWDMYHQIGDVLRSDEMAISLSSDFTARMLARLDAEPVFIAPAVTADAGANFANAANGDRGQSRKIRRFAVPGMAAAAAIAALAFVVMPQAPSTTPGLAAAAPSAASSAVAVARTPVGSSIMMAANKPGAQNLGLPGLATLAQQGEVVRDPRIDDYLLAHQQFAPSANNSAEYTRPAAFAVDTEK